MLKLKLDMDEQSWLVQFLMEIQSDHLLDCNEIPSVGMEETFERYIIISDHLNDCLNKYVGGTSRGTKDVRKWTFKDDWLIEMLQDITLGYISSEVELLEDETVEFTENEKMNTYVHIAELSGLLKKLKGGS